MEAAPGPHAKITDIATGTAIVLTDLANTLPSTCELDGFDIDGRQFPTAEALPQNVKLRIADARDPMSAKFHGRHDIVCIRYLELGVTPEYWEVIARNVFDVVK